MQDVGLSKYDQEVYSVTIDLFKCLPLAAVIDKKYICLHGGLSKEVTSKHSCESTTSARYHSRGYAVIWSGLTQPANRLDASLMVSKNEILNEAALLSLADTCSTHS